MTCKTGHQQYRDLHRCLAAFDLQELGVQQAPWFEFYLQNTIGKELLTKPTSISLRRHFQGHAHRGMYVDQLANYLCAGFDPEQFLIYTSLELHDNPQGVLQSISKRMGHELEVHEAHQPLLERGVRLNSRSKGRQVPDRLRRQLHALFEPFSFRLIHFLDAFGFQYNRTAMLSELGIFGAPRGGDDDDDDDDGGGGEAS